jgi:hypothetical protein
MDAIRDLLDEQWLASVPKGVTDIEKWRKDEADRRRVRQQSLRNAEEAALLLPAVQQQGKFREDVRKWVEEMLEPQLDSKEKKRLETAATKGPPYAYFHTVLVLSEAHRLKPPGLAAQWDRFREPRAKAAKAPG